MKEIEEFLFDSGWNFSFEWISKKACGTIEPAKMEVKINIRLMIIETVLHEFYHYKHPELGEEEVEKMAQAKVQALTTEQIFELTDKLVAIFGEGR